MRRGEEEKEEEGKDTLSLIDSHIRVRVNGKSCSLTEIQLSLQC